MPKKLLHSKPHDVSSLSLDVDLDEEFELLPDDPRAKVCLTIKISKPS